MIASENIDAIVRHTEIEQSIVSELYTIQKVIDPMEELYKTVHPGISDAEIPKLKTDLDLLRHEVLAQNEKKPRSPEIAHGTAAPESRLPPESLRETLKRLCVGLANCLAHRHQPVIIAYRDPRCLQKTAKKLELLHLSLKIHTIREILYMFHL